MKRLILILAILMLILSPVFSSSENELNPKGWWDYLWQDAHVTYDLYLRSVLLNREGINAGGGFSLGVKTKDFRFDTYFQGDYFLEPLGGKGGAAAMEFDVEAGITLNWNFLKYWNFDTYLGCDIGYYAQFVKTHYQPEMFTFGFNGLMLRPKLYTELNIGKWYGISIAVFYQFPIYPAYSEYRGLGIMVSIL